MSGCNDKSDVYVILLLLLVLSGFIVVAGSSNQNQIYELNNSINQNQNQIYGETQTMSLLDSGWEAGDLDDGGKWSGTTISGNGTTPTVSLTSPYAGTYNGACATVGGGGESKFYKTLSAAAIVFARWYTKIAVMPDDGNVLYLGTLFGSTEYMNAHIYRSGSSYYWGLDNNGGNSREASASNPVINTWYCVELERDNTNNLGKLWVDGVLKVSWSTAITQDNIRFDCGIAYSASTCTLVVDCVKVDASYIGPIVMDLATLYVDGKYIKDSLGAVVTLVGIDKTSFEDNADGYWWGSTSWTDAHVQDELTVMKSWGCNTVRVFFAVNVWVDDITDAASVISGRTALTRLLSFADAIGLYVILCPYTVISGITNGGSAVQDKLPYDAQSVGATDYIVDEGDFVDFWSSVANVLQTYDNAIFELWNEPQFGESSGALTAWKVVMQDCITAIRATGSTNIVLVPLNDWGRGYTEVNGAYNYPLNSYAFTGGNVALVAHLYNDHIDDGANDAYLLADIDKGLSDMHYYSVAETYPLVITEIAPRNDLEVAHQLEFFTNALNLFNSHGISYTGWGWWNVTSYTLLTSEAPTFEPDDAGDILIAAIDAINTPDPPAPPGGVPVPISAAFLMLMNRNR